MLPNAKLMARAFHRVAPVTTNAVRSLSTTLPSKKWEGRKADEHVAREPDSHNVQVDAVKEGKQERASGEGSAAASEKDVDQKNKKAKEDHPEAPGVVIGMNDERGGVSSTQSRPHRRVITDVK
jgi:hypothetical protein